MKNVKSGNPWPPFPGINYATNGKGAPPASPRWLPASPGLKGTGHLSAQRDCLFRTHHPTQPGYRAPSPNRAGAGQGGGEADRPRGPRASPLVLFPQKGSWFVTRSQGPQRPNVSSARPGTLSVLLWPLTWDPGRLAVWEEGARKACWGQVTAQAPTRGRASVFSRRFLSFPNHPPGSCPLFQRVPSAAGSQARRFLPHHSEIYRWGLVITNYISPFPH